MLRILDHLSLPDVVYASHVCLAWRAAARTHPTFSSRISLGDGEELSDRAVAFFLDRMSAGRRDALDLELYLCLHGTSQSTTMCRVRSNVIPALIGAFNRLVKLSIACEESFILDILVALVSGPAPRLSYLCFGSLAGPSRLFSPSYPLPARIFAGHAPKLRDVCLDCCDFPNTVASAFAGVRNITRAFKASTGSVVMRAFHPERFFRSCPALEELRILGNGCRLREACWTACPPRTISKLRSLTVADVDDDDDTAAVVQSLSHAQMCRVDVNTNTATVGLKTLNLLTGHLQDSPHLTLSICCTMGRLHCCVTDATRRRQRTISHALDDLWTACPVNGPGGRLEALKSCFNDIAYRLSRVYMSDHEAAWDFLLAIFADAVLVNVETLTIMLVSGNFERIAINGTLSLPSLRRLELVSPTKFQQVQEEALVRVVGMMLPGPFPLREKLVLVQQNVHVCGDGRLMDGYFA
ncbi:hypothetical protein AURDEDRAFT_176143 [Auricularia subglabra TFB-10046 SS5]|uniref:F-box domain-containing protein n=1 Tax=Auricularia subglabra (strain TFB-10046 / SS5) TaxID=717982 RepID=J0WQJ7_AURST|nr:hypothetical protein AURDEDRAFT_176143 [Auricularia subglabra TFB-10046 SS5]